MQDASRGANDRKPAVVLVSGEKSQQKSTVEIFGNDGMIGVYESRRKYV